MIPPLHEAGQPCLAGGNVTPTTVIAMLHTDEAKNKVQFISTRLHVVFVVVIAVCGYLRCLPASWTQLDLPYP